MDVVDLAQAGQRAWIASDRAAPRPVPQRQQRPPSRPRSPQSRRRSYRRRAGARRRTRARRADSWRRRRRAFRGLSFAPNLCGNPIAAALLTGIENRTRLNLEAGLRRDHIGNRRSRSMPAEFRAHAARRSRNAVASSRGQSMSIATRRTAWQPSPLNERRRRTARRSSRFASNRCSPDRRASNSPDRTASGYLSPMPLPWQITATRSGPLVPARCGVLISACG